MNRETVAILISLVFVTGSLAASEAIQLAPIGEHYKVAKVEKSENPQNVMIVYTQLDQNCHIAETDGLPVFDFYWLMNGERYKPTHRLIKNAIRKQLKFEKKSAPGKVSVFKVSAKDTRRLGPEVAAQEMTVSSVRTKDGCEVHADLDSIRIQSFFGQSKKTFKPPFRKMVAVTVKGIDQTSGVPAEKKFNIK